MPPRVPSPFPGWRALAAVAALAAALGLTVAVAAGARSIADSTAAASYRPAEARTPTPRPTPTTTPTAPRATSVGAAGVAPRFYIADAAHMLLFGATAAYQTQDGGATWTKLPPAATTVADSGAAGRLLSGGSELSTSTTGGQSWQKVNITPAVAGPYSALAINPGDSAVWFIEAQGRLLRTRDAGVSWRQGLNGLPATLDKPVMRPAAAKDSFLLTSGPHVYLLKENGQVVDDLGALPSENAISDIGDLGSSIYVARASTGHVYVYRDSAWSAVSPRLGGPLGISGGHLLVADGGASLGKPGSVALSLDAGATWLAATNLPADQSIEAVAYASDGTAFAYGYAGDLFTSSDGGHAWRRLSTALRSN